MSKSGMSARSLLLLGALTALTLNKGLRRDVIRGTRGMVDAAQETFEDTLLPVIGYAAKHAGHTLENLREEAPQRVQSLWENAQESAQHLAEVAAARAARLAEEAEAAAEHSRKQAYGAARGVGIAGSQFVGDVVDEVSKRARDVVGDLSNSFEQQRDQVERNLLRARREAEKELRRTQKHWNTARLQKEVDRRLLPLQKQASRQLMLIEKEAAKNGYDLNLRASLPKGWLPEQRTFRPSNTAIALMAVGVGVVVVARVPAVRHAILDAVEAVNPDAAKKLTECGHSVRNVVGEMWVSDLEENFPPKKEEAKKDDAKDAKKEEVKEVKNVEPTPENAQKHVTDTQATNPHTDVAAKPSDA